VATNREDAAPAMATPIHPADPVVTSAPRRVTTETSNAPLEAPSKNSEVVINKDEISIDNAEITPPSSQDVVTKLRTELAKLKALLGDRAAPPPSPDTRDWGANEWVESLLLVDPLHVGGRTALARIRHREMHFKDAEGRFLALHRERPESCLGCSGWIGAREQHRPVLDFGVRYSVTHDLDGRSDRTVTPTPVRYRTVGWHVGAYERMARRWSADARVDFADSALISRTTRIPIYDFNTRTGWLGVTRHVADRHTMRAAVGSTDYSPNDGTSVANKRFSRLRLAWDRVTWQNRAVLSFEQGPFLGRGLATQQVFRLFKEQRIHARFEQNLSSTARIYGVDDLFDYSDGNTFSNVTVGVKLRADTHRIDLSVAQGHRMGRFLDEGGGNLSLVFVPTRTVRVVDHWRRPFPFRFSASALVRTYEEDTTVQQGVNPGDPPISRVSPVNRETALTVEAAYQHPALKPLSFGVYGDYVHFQRDAFAYSTVNEAGPGLFVQLADASRPSWDYLLRYEGGIRWDEDPANDHFVTQRLRAKVGRSVGRHLSTDLESRYLWVSHFGDRRLMVTGHLRWRF